MARIGKAQKEAIRNSIIEVSRRLFVEKGYDKTSTSLIAKEVGIAEGTIFNYFKKKSDILVEIFSSDYLTSVENNMPLDYESGVVEIYVSYYEKAMNRILKLPKKMMLDMFIIAMNAAKKSPDTIAKYAALDFQFLDGLEILTNDLIEKGMLKSCDARILAESVFSTIVFELMMYLYESDYSKHLMYQRIKDKIKFDLECRIP